VPVARPTRRFKPLIDTSAAINSSGTASTASPSRTRTPARSSINLFSSIDADADAASGNPGGFANRSLQNPRGALQTRHKKKPGLEPGLS